MNVDPRTGRFDIAFELPGSTLSRRAGLRFTGTVTETVEAATLTRSLRPGEVIKASDVVIERRPKTELRGDGVAAEQAVGMAAQAALRSGQALRADDLIKPQIVQRNEAVTITYEVPGIMLTVRGKALEAGAHGRRRRRAQHPIEPHRPGHRHRARPRHHRRRDRRSSRPPAALRLTTISRFLPPSERSDHASASCRPSSCVTAAPLRSLVRLLRARPPGHARRAAAAVGDRESDHATRLQARAHADADAAARLLQPELAVAERLARLLQGSARAPGRRHPHRHGQPQRQGGDRQRDPAQPRQQGRFRHRPICSAAKKMPITDTPMPAASSPPIPTRRATARARSTAPRP